MVMAGVLLCYCNTSSVVLLVKLFVEAEGCFLDCDVGFQTFLF